MRLQLVLPIELHKVAEQLLTHESCAHPNVFNAGYMGDHSVVRSNEEPHQGTAHGSYARRQRGHGCSCEARRRNMRQLHEAAGLKLAGPCGDRARLHDGSAP
ncbi:hypothetical protein EJB05_03485, partial [Eragrostis curvula]